MIQIYEVYLKKKIVQKIVLSFHCQLRANVPVKNWLHGNVYEGQLFFT